MKLPLATFIGFRFLLAEWQKASSRALLIVSLLGMALGLSTFLVGQSILTTFQKTYLSSILGFNAHVIIVNDVERPMDSFQGIIPEAYQQSTHVSHYRYKEGVLLTPGGIHSVMLKGVSRNSLKQVYQLNYEFFEGYNLASLEENSKYPRVLLGQKIYQDWLLTKKSNLIKIISAKTQEPAVNLAVLSQTYEVIGAFESGLSEFDSKFMLLSETLFQSESNSSSGYEIKMDEPEKAIELASLIQKKVPQGVEVIAWQTLNAPLFEALKLEKTVFLLVMFFIVFISTLNIGGVVLMILYKKKDDLQGLIFLGLSKKSTKQILIGQALLFSLITMIAGYLLSWGLIYLMDYIKLVSLDPQVYRVAHLSFSISLSAYIAASFFVSLVSILIASWMSRWVLQEQNVLRERGL